MTLLAGAVVGLTVVNLLGACVIKWCIHRARVHRVAHVPLSDSSSRRAPPGRKKPPSKPPSKLWGSRKGKGADDAEAGLSMVAYDAAQEEMADELPAAGDSIASAPQSFRSNIELPNSYAESMKTLPERVAIQRDRTTGTRYMGQVDDPTLEVEID